MSSSGTLLVAFLAGAPGAGGTLELDVPRGIRYELGGELGRRLERNVDGWLLPAPRANPGMLEMFRARDRKPEPKLVPWAGEFAGKYLLSLVQALDLTARADLREHTASFVKELVATQDEDGYLGPFPRRERLLGNWDLWGHYHVILGLLLWEERTGDATALAAARRAADLICRTYLDSGRRVLDAGSPEMNMAVIHALGALHRRTGVDSYLRLMREIEKDWEKAGDYLRAGLEGVDFHASPRPRWESLHDLQGLVELHRITGDERYRKAFIHLWRSIARLDRHNTGGFSSGEQAVGHPYSPAAIETCCTIAWMAITCDMLRLTGEAAAADELELSTWNGMLGAQHPSGRWWTYNTPMNGAREASAHSIVFQARAGTPELNCCSVNGPRGLGMLAEWAVLAGDEGPVINHYGPFKAWMRLPDGRGLGIEVEGGYPAELQGIRVVLHPERETEMTLRLRSPGWSRSTSFTVEAVIDGTGPRRDPPGRAAPGKYIALKRLWRDGDRVSMDFDPRLRVEAGEREQAGRISVYRGPILLAFDPRWNPFDEEGLPPLDARTLAASAPALEAPQDGILAPILLVTVPGAAGSRERTVRLCDFAGAGAAGSAILSWLPAVNAPPAPVVLDRPRDGGGIPPGRARFTIRPRPGGSGREECTLVISSTRDFARIAVRAQDSGRRFIIDGGLEAGEYFWKVIARNGSGEVESEAWSFRIDPTLEAGGKFPGADDDGLLLRVPLRGGASPERGILESVAGVEAAPGPSGEVGAALAFDGRSGRARYSLLRFPEEDYAAAVRVAPASFPDGRIAQVFSAWCAPGDDPLRITIEGGKVFARIEAEGRSFSTRGVDLRRGEWAHIAAVKSGPKLVLYLDGEEKASAEAPELVASRTRLVALGGNPLFDGNEFFHGSLAGFTLHARALTPEEVRRESARVNH